MKIINIRDTKVINYDLKFFEKVGSLTAIRRRVNGEYYQANFERGMLLYHLALKLKPEKILELGTGRGYASLCMARAMNENRETKKDLEIDTIDIVRDDMQQLWLTKDGMQKTTLSELMKKAYPQGMRRIIFYTGKTSMIKNWNKKYDLVYIDAGHDYVDVKEDWKNVNRLINDNSVIVFDDYSPKDFGVKKLVDEIDGFNKALIIMDRQIFPDDRKNVVVDYGQVIISKRELDGLL